MKANFIPLVGEIPPPGKNAAHSETATPVETPDPTLFSRRMGYNGYGRLSSPGLGGNVMCPDILLRKRSYLAWMVLFLTSSAAWGQSAGYPYPYSGYPYPSSGYWSFAPYWGSVPSYYGGAPLPYQAGGLSSNPVSSYLSAPGTVAPGYLGTASSPASVLSDAAILWPSSRPTPRLENRAHIWLHVPADAEVWFEGAKTKQTGTLRYFFSPPLEAGKSYSYQVQVRWQKEGKTIERKRRIVVHPGDALQLDFKN
jgi:uncharacterized protein (TIGR03000 family)